MNVTVTTTMKQMGYLMGMLEEQEKKVAGEAQELVRDMLDNFTKACAKRLADSFNE